MAAYGSTSVPIDRSQGQIRKLLNEAGASRLGFSEERDETGQRWAMVVFVIGVHGVRLRVPLKPVDEREVRAKFRRARSRTEDQIRDDLYEQEERRIWRVLAWNLKARMVAVTEEVETFEEAFLAHLLDPRTGTTVYEQLARKGRIELEQPLRALPPGGDSA
jgi:hypothetical protein